MVEHSRQKQTPSNFWSIFRHQDFVTATFTAALPATGQAAYTTIAFTETPIAKIPSSTPDGTEQKTSL